MTSILQLARVQTSDLKPKINIKRFFERPSMLISVPEKTKLRIIQKFLFVFGQRRPTLRWSSFETPRKRSRIFHSGDFTAKTLTLSLYRVSLDRLLASSAFLGSLLKFYAQDDLSYILGFLFPALKEHFFIEQFPGYLTIHFVGSNGLETWRGIFSKLCTVQKTWSLVFEWIRLVCETSSALLV